MSRRRPTIQYPQLTSMLDVLFILVFAALIQAAALEQARSEETRAAIAAIEAPPDAGPLAALAAPVEVVPAEAAALHGRALDTLDSALRGLRPVIARVAEDGTLRALEVAGETRPLGVPLVEKVEAADVEWGYLGDRSPDLRLCALVALRLGAVDLADQLIIIAPDRPLADLRVALARGLASDVRRCQIDQRGLAVVVEPTAEPAPGAPPTSPTEPEPP